MTKITQGKGKKIIFIHCEVFKNSYLIGYTIKGQQSKFLYPDSNPEELLNLLSCCTVTLVGYGLKSYVLNVVKYITKLQQVKDPERVNKVFEFSTNLLQNKRPYQNQTQQPTELNKIDLMGIYKKQLILIGAGFDVPSLYSCTDYNAEASSELYNKLLTTLKNKLTIIQKLFETSKSALNLRYKMSKALSLDLMSKSDPEIAEECLKYMLQGNKLKAGDRTKTNLPEYLKSHCDKDGKLIKYENMVLHTYAKHLENIFSGTEINCTASLPFYKDNLEYRVTMSLKNITGHREQIKQEAKSITYKTGYGGLHSETSSLFIEADNNFIIIEADVSSYYPSLIINNNITLTKLNNLNQVLLKPMIQRKEQAKQQGDKIGEATAKLIINSIYGKFNDPYSVAYEPQAQRETVFIGQLTLLDLIYKLNTATTGHKVKYLIAHPISANTDSVTFLVNKQYIKQVEELLNEWQQLTGLKLDFTEYKSIAFTNINKYIAIKPDNSVKVKGYPTGNPLKGRDIPLICVEAVAQYMIDKTPPEKTIYNCEDITKFLIYRQAKNGAYYQGQKLGNCPRWIYTHAPNYLSDSNGVKVSNSDHAFPLVELPRNFQDVKQFISYNLYLSKALTILKETGILIND